jgi:hypothetical protein
MKEIDAHVDWDGQFIWFAVSVRHNDTSKMIEAALRLGREMDDKLSELSNKIQGWIDDLK